MRAGGRILMIFGLVLGIIAAGANFIILLSEDEGGTDGEGGAPMESIRVVVATQPIDPWREIPPDALVVRDFPEPVPDDAIREELNLAELELTEEEAAELTGGEGQAEGEDQAEGESSDAEGTINGTDYIAGKISNTRIYPGQVIVESQLVDKELEEQRLGLGSNASYIVPDGQVAMALPVDSMSTIAGALSAGDFVDVIAEFETEFIEEGEDGEVERTGEEAPSIHQFVMQRVQVLRVGRWTPDDEDDGGGGGIVTILVEPQLALELRHVINNSNWTFVLRSITDEEEFVTEPVDLDYLNDQYNIIP